MERNLVHNAGRINSEVRIQLLDLLKVVSLTNLTNRGDVKRLYSIAVELLDHAQRYGSSDTVSFDWHVEGDQIVMRITIHADRDDAQRVVQTVESINSMTAADVAAAFRAQLLVGSFGEKGGAGPGMLHIAKRSVGRIAANIQPLDMERYLCVSHVSAMLR